MIGIRVDANEQIATGHLMRCLSIADALKERGIEVVFIHADYKPQSMVKKKGYKSLCLNTRWNQMEEELGAMKRTIKKEEISMLLIDSYYVTKNYMKELSRFVKTAYIDDLYAGIWDCSILINYTVYAGKFPYREKYTGTRLLLGEKYAPLRAVFSERKMPDRDKAGNVLFLTGGTDPYSLSLRFAERLQQETDFGGIHVNIICGKYNQDIKKLKQMEEKNPQICVFQNVDHIEELMEQADIAVTAGGTTLYELAAMGVPTICYTMADNQLENAQWFAKKKMAVYVGDIRKSEFRMDCIFENIRWFSCNALLRQELSMNGKKYIDGKGAERIAEILVESQTDLIESRKEKENGVLRQAVLKDMELLFRWANDSTVRKNSFQTSAITYEEHKKWYQELLKRTDCRQYIYEYNGEEIGQIRASVNNNIAEIGYSICAEKRGQGYGKKMLRLFQEQVKSDFPEVEILSAKVKTDNLASQKTFLSTGYQEKYRSYELFL